MKIDIYPENGHPGDESIVRIKDTLHLDELYV